jgi:molybdate transport system substrate-binding protein
MRRSVGALLALPLVLAGCGSSPSSGAAPSSADGVTGTVTVFAAASLTGVFGVLGKDLERQHPGLTVTFSFAGSQALAAQLTQGAPADVFASADQAQMDVVTKAGLQAGPPATFARNVLEIAVPPGNPGRVTGLADFAKPDLTLAVCAPAVPCGAAAEQVFAAAGISAQPDSEEQDVKAALTKVQLGEVDAALVYATDVQAAGSKVEGITFPEAEEAPNSYPVTTLEAAPNPRAAKAFVDLVEGPTGRHALQAAGFRTP